MNRYRLLLGLAILSAPGTAFVQSNLLPENVSFPLLQGTTVHLDGTALGGEFVFSWANDPTPPHIVIPTKAGDSSDEVLAELRDVLESHFTNMGFGIAEPRIVNDTLVTRMVLGHVFGGTETGFGYTPPITGVYGTYNPTTLCFEITWNKPSDGQYDVIRFAYFSGSLIELPGDADSLDWPVLGWDTSTGDEYGQSNFAFWGIKDGIPSAATSVFMDVGRMIEATDPAYSLGVRPGWRTITTESLKLYRAERLPAQVGKNLKYSEAPEARPGYQAVIVPPNERGALYRPVTGMKPNTLYNVSVDTKFPTAPSPLGEENWEVEVSLIQENSNDQKPRIEKILRGKESANNRIVLGRYSSNATDKHDGWIRASTADNQGPVLFPDSEMALVVTFKNIGQEPMDFGLDWFKIEQQETKTGN